MNGRTGQHAQNRVVTVNKHELEFVSMDHVLIHCMKVGHVNMMDVSISIYFFYFSVLFTPLGYGEWQNWSFCSKTRGTGQKTRTRICLEGPCIGSLHENLPCRLDGSEY